MSSKKKIKDKIPSRNFLIAKSAVRDIFQKKTRSLITIIAIMFVTAFPIAFLRTSNSLTLTLNNQSEEFQLGHIDFQSNFLNETHIQQITTIVNDKSNNTALIEKRITGSGTTVGLDEIYVASFIGVTETPPLINQIRIANGDYIKSSDEVMVLQSFADETNLSINDNITIKGFTGTKTLKIVAFVQSTEYMSFKVSSRAVFWLDESVTQDLVGLPDNVYTSVLVYLDEETTYDETIAIGELVRLQFNSIGKPFTFIDYPRFISIQSVLLKATDLASRYLSICTILTVIISGFVMYIIMSRFVAEQRSLIGVFHSFGFRHTAIIRMFTIRALILGIIGCLLGIATSYGILALTVYSLGQNWGITNIALSIDWFTGIWVSLVSLATTLAFAIIPSIRVARMNPYEALRGKTTIKVNKKSILDYILFTKYLPQIPRIGIRNLTRNKARTWLTIFSVMSALAFSSSLVATVDIVNQQIPRNIDDSVGWDIVAYFQQPVTQSVIENYTTMDHVQDVETFIQISTMSVDNQSAFIYLEIQPFNSNMTNYNLKAGQNFTSEGANECLINARLIKDLGLEIGDNLTLWYYHLQLELNVIGISDSWATPSSIIIQEEFLKSMMGGMLLYSAMRLNVEDGYKEEVSEKLNSEDYKIVYASTDDFYSKRIIDNIMTQQVIANVATVLGFIVAFIAMLNTTIISSLERTREYAIMRTFGFSSNSILQVNTIENLILIPLSFLVSLVFAYPITLIFLGLIQDFAQALPYLFSWQSVWINLLFVLATIIIAIIPGWRYNVQQNLADSLREE